MYLFRGDNITTNNEMVDYLIDIGSLQSKNIIEAFRNVDRADFVAQKDSFDIYEDYPLSIGEGQTISQPRTVAMMMEMLSPKKGEKILDIGSGSGWTSALLAYIVADEGYVIGVERVPEFVKFGNANLRKYGFKNAKIINAKKTLGIKGEKFDRILVSASADTFPNELLSQLNIGAKMVIPVQHSIYEVTKTDEDSFHTIEYYGFVFVPLIV